MNIYRDHEGNDIFLLSFHDASPVMIQPDREAGTYNLLLQPEVREWLEQVPGAFRLRETPDFVEITFTREDAAMLFKVRWYGSYPVSAIYAGDVLAIEHSVMTKWETYDFGRDVLIVSDDRPVRLAEIMSDRLCKVDFIVGGQHTEKDFFRQFEGRRRDGTFKKRRRK